MSDDEPNNPVDPDRRNVLQAAGAALVAGMAAVRRGARIGADAATPPRRPETAVRSAHACRVSSILASPYRTWIGLSHSTRKSLAAPK